MRFILCDVSRLAERDQDDDDVERTLCNRLSRVLLWPISESVSVSQLWYASATSPLLRKEAVPTALRILKRLQCGSESLANHVV
jgi:hypothetical protein